MVNTKLLDHYIKDSGLKLSHIADSLGISEKSLHEKINNMKDFRVSEIHKLCNLLYIVHGAEYIFFI